MSECLSITMTDLSTAVCDMGTTLMATHSLNTATSDTKTIYSTLSGIYSGSTMCEANCKTVQESMSTVPSRKYIHDHIVSEDYPDGSCELCYIDNARKVHYKRLFSPQERNIHWITELIERCIDEMQSIYRAKPEGKDTNMPTTLLTNEQIRRMLGLDCTPSSEDGYPTPKPVKVETYNDRVVKVTFKDGSFTKSVCSDNDTFDLDVGITICILKRVMGKNGHKLYNNMMRDIHKIMDENEKDKEKARKEKAERKTKQRKTELKAAAKKAKARQEQIDIQKTAFVEALRVSGIGSGDDLK